MGNPALPVQGFAAEVLVELELEQATVERPALASVLVSELLGHTCIMLHGSQVLRGTGSPGLPLPARRSTGRTTAATM
jgi:hypothetical protein